MEREDNIEGSLDRAGQWKQLALYSKTRRKTTEALCTFR